ncbi:hypothetical protein G6F31_018356 [Rhizopus arrhizus]|nr:hypothetical protein G6F31_018356 [Rhizopus arrhizus]
MPAHHPPTAVEHGGRRSIQPAVRAHHQPAVEHDAQCTDRHLLHCRRGALAAVAGADIGRAGNHVFGHLAVGLGKGRGRDQAEAEQYTRGRPGHCRFL